ncbi:MAG: YaiI/YqxD family protein [Christensenellales bacterium]|jgi:uncharacterized protein YaiI (UPF0178 family)
MRIYVDADACPVVRETEEVARRHGLPVTLVCDTNHVMTTRASEVVVVGAGQDAVDFELVNRAAAGDVVVTQDYGVAAMALAKGAHPIHQSGMWYTNQNIDSLLAERHIKKEARRASSKNHLKGPRKRTAADDRRFTESLERLILQITHTD